ncbi:MAG: hypothetical protein AB7Q17_16755 [Phycisphaerae bacterium]
MTERETTRPDAGPPTAIAENPDHAGNPRAPQSVATPKPAANANPATIESVDDAAPTADAASDVVPIPIRTAQPDRAELSAGVDEIAPLTRAGSAPDAAPITDGPADLCAESHAIPPADAAPPPATKRGGKRFQIPKRGGARGDAPGDAGAGAGAGGATGARQAPAWCRALYHGVDALLELIHRPFVRVPLGVRNIVGGCAAATIVVSVTAMYALPTLFPRHDAVDFLEERIADLNRPKPEPGAESHEEPENQPAPEAAPGGH